MIYMSRNYQASAFSKDSFDRYMASKKTTLEFPMRQPLNGDNPQFFSQATAKASDSYSFSMTPSPGVTNALVDIGITSVGHCVPGLGGYLTGKAIGADLAINLYGRIKDDVGKGITPVQATVCGAMGAAAEETASIAGNAMVFNGASCFFRASSLAGPVGIVAGAVGSGLIVKEGYEGVAKISPLVGDVAEKSCHRIFELSRNFEKLLKSKQMDSDHQSSLGAKG